MRILILCVLWLGGCSSTAVRCDAHLQAINAPTDKAGAGADAPTEGSVP
jgi:hypothetical protein